MSDIKEFKLPDLGEGLEEGEIVEWHVDVGDVIDLNQTVADIETAKAVVAVPSPFAGRVVERIGEVGESLAVGAVFLRIDTGPSSGDVQPSEVGASEGADSTAAVDGARPATSTGLDADEEPQPLVGYGQGKAGSPRGRRRRGGVAASGAGGTVMQRPLAKPPVRKLAKDLGVELSTIAPGSGPDGVITREDVHAASTGAGTAVATTAEQVPAGGPPSTPPAAVATIGFRGRAPGEVEPIRGIRKRIVQKMELSRRTIPAASCSRDADLTELWELRHELTAQARAEGHDVKITPFAVVMRAVVVALRRFPTLNARIVGRDGEEAGEIHLLEPIHLGFAADTDRGLVVPNIKDAHTLSLVELAGELARLADAARDGSIGPGELTGGTFTVNNYGAFGNDDGDPIINHPEAGILGIGAIRERPWVLAPTSGSEPGAGELAVRRVARFTLAFDHRICDGGEAGRFVTYVAELCERPSRILLHA
jgi:2-oxoisovalerate dehydrogenase E2 component (dihydrolipoyl transacylase)